MADIVLKIKNNEYRDNTKQDEVFYKATKGNNTWEYSFANTTNSNVYIASAIGIVSSSGTIYSMPLLVSTDFNAVSFNAKLNSQIEGPYKFGGSVQYKGTTYYYNKFDFPLPNDATLPKEYKTYNASTMEDATLKLLNDEEDYTFSKREILNLESLSQCNPNANTIFYGILSSTGNIEILDIQNKVKKHIKNGILNFGSQIIGLYANGKLFHQHIFYNSDYNVNTNILSIQLTDKINNLDKTTQRGLSNKIKIGSSYKYPEQVTLLDMLLDILNEVGYTVGTVATEDKTQRLLSGSALLQDGTIGTIKEYLNNIIIDYPYLSKDTLNNNLNKICTVGQIQLILDDDGYIKLINARPIFINKSIVIPRKNQYSDFNYSLIFDNQYDSVSIEYTIFNKEYGLIYSSEKLYISEDKIYIGNEEGKNEIKYDVYGAGNPTYWFQFNYNFNAKDLDSIIDISTYSQDIPYISIDANRTIYVKEGAAVTIDKDNEYDTIKIPLTRFSSDGDYIPYHEPYIQNDEVKNAFSYQRQLGGEDDGSIRIRGQVYWYNYTETPPSSILSATTYREYYITDCTFSIYMNKYSIANGELTIGNGNNMFSQSSNELLQQGKNDNNDILNLFSNNILSDYSEGISNGTVTVSCANYYDEDGNRVIDWSKGEMLQVGDTVKIEGDDRYWRITGRKFRYAGCPFVDLEVMELVYPIYETTISIDMSKSEVLNGTLTIPIMESKDFYVNWGDGSETYYNITTTSITHQYHENEFIGEISIKARPEKWRGIRFTNIADDNKLVITEIKYGSHIKIIYSDAFYGCSNLVSITLPSSLDGIGAYAFNGCSGLTTMNYLGTIEQWCKMFFGDGTANPITYTKALTIQGETITNLVIPDSVESIGRYAFYYYTTLTSVTIGSGVISIGEYAFLGCSGLTSVEIPKSVTSIGRSVFSRCSGLTIMTIKVTTPPTLANTSAIPDNVETIYVPSESVDAYKTATNWSSFADKIVGI